MIYNGSKTGYATTFERDARWLQELPAPIQDALRDSVADWASKVVLNTLRKERKNYPEAEAVQRVLNMVANWNASEREDHLYRLNRMRERGIDYDAPVRKRKAK